MAKSSNTGFCESHSRQVAAETKSLVQEGYLSAHNRDRIPARAVDAREACRLLGGIGLTTLYKLIGQGMLTPIKIGRRSVFSLEAIDAFLAIAQRNQ